MNALMLVFVISLLPSAFALEASVDDFDPKPAEAGQNLNVWIRIENPSDDPVYESTIEMKPKDGLRLSSGEDAVKSVGFIGSRSSTVEQFRLNVVEEAIEGTNLIEVVLRHDETEQIFNLPIEVVEKDREEVILEVATVQSDPTRIKPKDEDVKLEVTIQNLGEAIAKGAKAELKQLPEGITFAQSYSNLDLLGNIENDGQKVATFYIDVDEETQPGEYKARVELSYKYKPFESEDDYIIESVSLPVRITVKPIPLYEITNVELSPSELTAGDRNVQMKVRVKNVGQEEGDSVRIKVYGKSEQPFIYDVSSMFVAPSLKPGETGEATIEFSIEEDASLQEFLLDAEIKNVVDDDVITYPKTIPITIKNPKPNNPFVPVVIVCVVLIVIGVFVVRTMRKGKRKQKTGKSRYQKSSLDE